MFPSSAIILTNEGLMPADKLRTHHKLMNPLTLAMVDVLAIQSRTMDQAELARHFVQVPKSYFAKGAPKSDVLLARSQVIFAKNDGHFEAMTASDVFGVPKPKIFGNQIEKIIGVLTKKEMPILVNGIVVLSTSRESAKQITQTKPTTTSPVSAKVSSVYN